MNGQEALPGNYKVKMTVDGKSIEREFKILKDTGSSMRIDDMQAKFDFLIKVRNKVSDAHEVITAMRSAKAQIQ